MERKDIIPFLTTLSPLERDLKQQHPVSFSKFEELLRRHGLHHGSESLSETFLKEADYFHDGERVRVQKHPCYAPAACHAHDFIEIVYVLSGRVRQSIFHADGKTEELDLKAGQLLIQPPHLRHSIFCTQAVCVDILIRTAAMKQTLQSLVAGDHALFDFFLYTLYENERPSYLLFQTEEDATIKNVVLDLVAEYENQAPFCQNILLLMLGLIFTCLQRHYAAAVHVSSDTATSQLARILHYLQENYPTATVTGTAEHFSVSTSWLEQAFRQHLHRTVSDLIRETRINRACELLATTRLSVGQIAEAVGYTDVTHFIRLFKKCRGMTPLQYRKQLL